MGQCWFPAAIWLVNLIFRGVVYDLMVAGGVVQSIVDKNFKPLSVKHDKLIGHIALAFGYL
jgi:hypothetical protein